MKGLKNKPREMQVSFNFKELEDVLKKLDEVRGALRVCEYKLYEMGMMTVEAVDNAKQGAEPAISDAAIKPDAEESEGLKEYGRQGIRHPWFTGLRETLKYFVMCTEFEKKARIVIDYDPQKPSTIIKYYRSADTPIPAEAEQLLRAASQDTNPPQG